MSLFPAVTHAQLSGRLSVLKEQMDLRLLLPCTLDTSTSLVAGLLGEA
jgi:hypothetical protein